MFHVGYKLSSEEFGPTELIRQAVRAETAGFDFALISDHFHPWSDRQGQSPFVWAVLDLEALRSAHRAGFDHVCVHQIGPDQEGFTRFYEAEILPRVRHVLAPRRSSLSRKRAA
jgi:hypothetical protein